MIKKVILVSLTILWMLIIFLFSNQKSINSTKKSQSFVMSTIVNIYKVFNSDITDEEIDNIVEIWDVPVRKMAHFTEYLILGVLIFFTFREFGCKNMFWMIILCILYACCDEFHQIFVPGRSGNIIDIFIDSLGSCSSILFLSKLKERKKHEVY